VKDYEDPEVPKEIMREVDEKRKDPENRLVRFIEPPGVVPGWDVYTCNRLLPFGNPGADRKKMKRMDEKAREVVRKAYLVAVEIEKSRSV